MSWERDGVLAVGRWCLLAWEDDDGRPRLAPHAFWSDGAGLWLALPAAGPEVGALRSSPRCVVWVAPVERGGPGVAVTGRARVFGLEDPVGLVLHGPALSAAVLALASRSPGLLLEQARQVAVFPPRLPRNRAVVRLAIERLRGLDPPDQGHGMTPPLPPVIPADIRRRLGGVHSAVVAFRQGSLRIAPASLCGGFRLTADERLTEGVPAAVGLVPCAADAPLPEVGLALEGGLVAGPALRVERARWWLGGREGGAAVPAGADGLVLPD